MFQGPVIIIGLPAMTLLLCALLRTPWKLVAILFLVIPFFAAFAAIVPPDRSYPLLSLKFVRALIGVHIFAILAFGYAAPLIGSVAPWLVRVTSLPERVTRRTLLGAGAAVGALVGLSVMSALTLYNQLVNPGPAEALFRGLWGWGIVGIASGAISGILVAEFSRLPHNSPGRSSTA